MGEIHTVVLSLWGAISPERETGMALILFCLFLLLDYYHHHHLSLERMFYLERTSGKRKLRSFDIMSTAGFRLV